MTPSLSLADQARQIRVDVMEMSHRAHIGHVGSCFSIVDLLTVLYFDVMKVKPSDPAWAERDRFLLSKGHASAALYSTLARRGYFPVSSLETYGRDGTLLAGHPERNGLPGIEVSTGSLGHGAALGVGMAKAAKRLKQSWRTFVLLSDGECDEGSTWEAALLAAHHQLDNLTFIVDRNEFQALGKTEDALRLEPFADKWKAFGWSVREVDGHDLSALPSTLKAVPFQTGKPSVLIARTVLGKGVSFMEGKLEWHYIDPKDDHYREALRQLSPSR